MHGRTRLRTSAHTILPPIGIALIAAELRNIGHTVEIVDANFYGLTVDSMTQQVVNFKPDVVGITTLTDSFAFLEDSIPLIKQAVPGIPIILGGPLVSSAEIVMQNCEADIAVIGEGDATTIESITALENHTDLVSVKGICLNV